LLNYRLTQHLSVANSQFDVPEFGSGVRSLARVLGSALEGSASIQAAIVNALRGLEERRRTEQSQTPTAVVLEILLALCHGKTPEVYVGKITELANNLLETRGENMELSPRAVGEVLRQELGLVTRRGGPGYELALDGGAQRRVHRFAIAHDVLQRVADCPHCREVVVTVPGETQSTSGV
jgi:hypothetical protein